MPKISCDNIKPSRYKQEGKFPSDFFPGDILYAPGIPGNPFIKLESEGMVSLRDGSFEGSKFLCYPIKTILRAKPFETLHSKLRHLEPGCPFSYMGKILMKIEDYPNTPSDTAMCVILSDGRVFSLCDLNEYPTFINTFSLESRED